MISVSLRSDPAWHPAGTVLLAVSLAGAAAFLLLGAGFGHKHGPGGLYERIFLTARKPSSFAGAAQPRIEQVKL